jgi:hypothetical protein
VIGSAPIKIILTLTILTFVWNPGTASGLSAENHYPIAPGNSWTHAVDDGSIEVRTFLSQTGFENGVATSILQITGTTRFEEEELTNDGSGLFQHAVAVFEIRAVYDPAYKFLNADFMIGDVIANSGNLISQPTGQPTQIFPYTGNSRVLRRELVEVAFGTFDAVVVEATVTSLGSTGVDTIWFADGIGIVKIERSVGGTVSTSELVSTNVPEPTAEVLGLAALAALSGLNLFQVIRRRERLVQPSHDRRVQPASNR